MHRSRHPLPHPSGRFAPSGPGSNSMHGGAAAEGLAGGRKLAAADLELLILTLLAVEPRHGYQIIKALGERTRGFYAPSPGMVYPALGRLEALGHASVKRERNRKRYQISEAGREALSAHREAADALLAGFERAGARMEHLLRIMRREDETCGEASETPCGESLRRAQHELHRALLARRGCAPREEERIAEILRRAAEAIGAAPPA